MSDLSKFHYYDMPPRFTVNLRVTGRSSITVNAADKEEAKTKAEEMLDVAYQTDDWEQFVDLEEVDDVDLSYISANPTRMYLIRNPNKSSTTATSHPEEGDEPREPNDRDTEAAERMGYTMSWGAS